MKHRPLLQRLHLLAIAPHLMVALAQHLIGPPRRAHHRATLVPLHMRESAERRQYESGTGPPRSTRGGTLLRWSMSFREEVSAASESDT